MPETILIV